MLLRGKVGCFSVTTAPKTRGKSQSSTSRGWASEAQSSPPSPRTGYKSPFPATSTEEQEEVRGVIAYPPVAGVSLQR